MAFRRVGNTLHELFVALLGFRFDDDPVNLILTQSQTPTELSLHLV